MGLLSSLNRQQKEALVLLQTGTFLEYFDLMLYVHMAVLLNDLFFPKSDPYTTSLLTAFAFCSTYVLRPIGALVFGWLGDNIGRKSTIIITTLMMSISCAVMANLPTYAQVGITASWIMIFCRMAQGMSSMGEGIGAVIYIAESITRPASYPAVAFIGVASTIGGMTALGVSALVTSFGFNWRLAFWSGAVIAVIGTAARTRLRETPDFIEMKRQQMKEANKLLELNDNEDKKENPMQLSQQQQKKLTWKETKKIKTLFSFFLMYCGWPLCFYLSFIYFNPILKENFGYSSEMIIRHNFLLSIILVISLTFWSFLSYHIHPIKILKARGIAVFFLMILLPFFITAIDSSLQLFLIQASMLLLPISAIPAEAVLMYHLPIGRRFTYASFLYALTRALVYIITSFGLIYLTKSFNHYGLWFITLPVSFGFLYGVRHFEGLERKWGMFRPNNDYFKTDLLKKGWLKHES
jgi:MHS family proline/betaine transporter-like MFS transporter